MSHKRERGAVLVAVLLVLVLLSLLGAGALMRSTIDVKVVKNLGKSKASFYAAEAAQEIGTGTTLDGFIDTLKPYQPTNTDIVPSGIFDGGDFPGTAFPGTVPDSVGSFSMTYRISNPMDANPASVPTPYPFTTSAGGQQLLHDAYRYRVAARAVSKVDNATEASTIETIRVLETPLVQYFLFFNDDLSWHTNAPMTAWGRVHTNGNLHFGNTADLYYRDYDLLSQSAPCIMTARSSILYGSKLQQGGSASGGGAPVVNVRVRNAGDIPAASGDYEAVDETINGSNQGSQEARFADGGSVHVKVGVDNLPTPGYASIKRNKGVETTEEGFYERMALAPNISGVRGMVIDVDTGQLRIRLSGFGDVTTLVKRFQVQSGQPVFIANWPGEAKTMADGSVATTADFNAQIPASDVDYGSIVYSHESRVEKVFFDDGRWHNFSASLNDGTGYVFADPTDSTFSNNPWYPTVLELLDGRETQKVDLTVIDVQMLQQWYRDFLDWADDKSMINNSVDMDNEKLLIYVTRSQPNDAASGGTGANARQAVKLIGSKAGRTRGGTGVGVTAVDRQSSDTFITSTTIISSEPVYIEGDFNAPLANTGTFTPGGKGSAVVCDAITILSNSWSAGNAATWNKTHAPTVIPAAASTAVNTAIFAGRYNFRSGGSGDEAGIYDFVRLLENWAGMTVDISGAFVNLWFSVKAPAAHGTTYFTPPAARNFGWDKSFGGRTYWPPYVPCTYSVERESWQQN